MTTYSELYAMLGIEDPSVEFRRALYDLSRRDCTVDEVRSALTMPPHPDPSEGARVIPAGTMKYDPPPPPKSDLQRAKELASAVLNVEKVLTDTMSNGRETIHLEINAAKNLARQFLNTCAELDEVRRIAIAEGVL